MKQVKEMGIVAVCLMLLGWNVSYVPGWGRGI